MTDHNDSVGANNQHPIIAIALYLLGLGYVWHVGKFLNTVPWLVDPPVIAAPLVLLAFIFLPIVLSPTIICFIAANNLWSVPDAWRKS